MGAMAAFSRTSFTAAAGFPWSPFRFSLTRSHYTVNSTGKIIRSLIAHPNNEKSIFGRNRAMLSTMSVNSKPSKASSSSPWLMLPPTFDRSKNMVYQFYSLAEDKVVSLDKKKKKKRSDGEEEEIPDDKSAIVGSSHGWLALFNRKNLDLFLSNPISGRHIKLPPIHNLPDIPQENLDGGYGCVNNVIISSSDPENDDDCRAMITYGTSERLAFCCPSRPSTGWSLLGDTSCFQNDSLAYSSKRKLFLCAPAHSDIQAWDLRDPLSPSMTPVAELPRKVFYRSKREWELKRLCGLHFQFLVVKEGSDELFHVKKYVLHRVGPDGSFVDNMWCGSPGGGYDDSVPYKTVGFDVHKYDPETRSLVYMDGNLGGLALFVGPVDGGFALSPDEFPELKPNSIYYTDSAGLPEYCDQPYGGYDVGIFDYENAKFSSCYYPCGLKSMLTKIQPIPRWFTPSG